MINEFMSENVELSSKNLLCSIHKETALAKLFVMPSTVNKWMKIIHLLGVVKDRKLAKKIGVSPARVCQVRGALGIMPVGFPERCAKYGIHVEGYEEEKVLQ